jgi:hypothetical protein
MMLAVVMVVGVQTMMSYGGPLARSILPFPFRPLRIRAAASLRAVSCGTLALYSAKEEV